MRFVIVTVICLLLAGVAAGGSVASRDGKSYRGTIQLLADNRIQITPAGGKEGAEGAEGAAVVVPLAEVVRLSMVDEPPMVATSQPGAAALPASWREADIGRVLRKGDAAASDGGFTLRGCGWGTWGAEDSFHFAFQAVNGDVDVAAHLSKLPGEESRFQAGITIREGLEPNAGQVSVMVRPTDGSWHMNRRVQGGPTKAEPLSDAPPSSWIRLVRAGDAFGAFSSTDGKAWTPVGSVTLKLKSQVVAGLVCSAVANESLAEARFDHITLRTEPAGPSRGLALVDGSLLAGEARQLDARTLQYLDAKKQQRTIPAAVVAGIFTRPMLPGGGDSAGAKSGVSLTTGDFAEGDVRLEDGKLTVVSVVLGTQPMQWQQVARVDLRPAKPEGAYLVGMRDGSVYRCRSMSIGDGVVTVQSASAGAVTIDAADLTIIVGVVREGKP